MTGNHYGRIKGIADWLLSLDRNGSYDDIYNHWNYMSTEEQVIELEYLETILNEYIENETDKVWLASFNSALETVMKIQEELTNK